jgi:hypothetical protein
LSRRLGGPQSHSASCRVEKILFPLPANKTSAVQLYPTAILALTKVDTPMKLIACFKQYLKTARGI